jgi:hypothetical protein
MSKAFGLILMLAAMYVGMTLHAEGMEKAFGGVFAPIEPIERNSSAATALSGGAQAAEAANGGAARPRGRVTDVVRDRVTAHMQNGAERRSY